MNSTNLERVMETNIKHLRRDLEVVQQAAQISTAPSPNEVHLAWILGVGGIFCLVWLATPHQGPAYLGLLPMALGALAYSAVWRIRARRGGGRSATERRESSAVLFSAGIAIVGALVFLGVVSDLPISTEVAAGLLCLGIGIGGLVATTRYGEWRERVVLLLTFAMGLALVFSSGTYFVGIVGATFAIGGVSGALLMGHSIRKHHAARD